MVNWFVPEVQLTGNNVVLTIKVDGFTYGNWAEISGYIIQDDEIVDGVIQQPGAFIPFSAIQAAPDPATGASTVTVSVAAAGLTPGKDLKVITRVAEIEIWPTVLQAPQPPQGGTATRIVQGGTTIWQAIDGNQGSGTQGQGIGPLSAEPTTAAASATTPAATVRVSGPDPRVSVKGLRPGRQYRVTIEEDPE
jgi:hypothetical protein